MNYLKKYRKEAGLANTDENQNGEAANNPYSDNTPTKETLAYLNGMLKHKSTPVTTQFQNTAQNNNLMKTPVRRGSPGKKQTTSAMRLEAGGRNSQRQSAIKPFGKVDTNLVQNSSRKSIQMSGQSKKGQEPARSSRNFTGQQTSSPFTVAEKSTSNLMNQKLQSHNSSKRLPTKSAMPSAGSKLRTSTTGKKTPGLPSSIFTSSVRQSQNQHPMQHQANNTTPQNGNTNSIFRQEVTPQRVNTNTVSKHTATKTPNEERYNSSTSKQFQSRRKSTNQQSVQRNRTAKRRHGSQVSETASEKAVKDAMMKTTQKIFFPKAFALPGSKQAKREKQQQMQQQQQLECQEAEEEQDNFVEIAATAKRAVANFNTNESDDQEIIQAQQYAAVRKSLHQNQTFYEQDSCPMISYANPADDRHIVDERSFTSIENMIENQTDFGEVSKLSGGGTRRSRKDRSKNKTGRNAITPHIISGMKMLGDVGVSPNVRMIPGSDTISLELNVKGMTEPNKDFKDGPNTASQTEDSQTQATTSSRHQEPRKRNSFIGNLQRTTQQKAAELVPHSRNTAGTSSYYNNAYQQTQQPQSNLKGALNAYVAQTGSRSRTPLVNENSYSVAAAYEGGPQRLADKIMKPVLVSGATLHKKTISNAVQNSVANTITPQKSQANRPVDRHQSAMRLQHQQRSSVQYDQTLRQQKSFVGVTKTTQGSTTPLRHREDNTPTRLALDRSRYSNVTTPIDRASESLEKINGVFRSISVGTFDAISLIKKPAKSDIDGCYIFCRFVNAFRPETEQWDSFSLQTWQSMQSFMLYSPNCQKICLEVQQIKKKVLRPHICRVQNHTYDQLADLRSTFMSKMNERNLNVQFKHSQVVRKLVMLVLVSVMHLLPEHCQPDELLPESGDAQDYVVDKQQDQINCQSPENHSETAEEIIDLVTNHGPDFTPQQQQVEADSDSDDDEADEAEVNASISQRDEMIQRQDDLDLQKDNFGAASYAENEKINTDQKQYHNGPLAEVKTHVQQQTLTNNRYSQQLLDDESCADEQDEPITPYQAAEAEDVDSYKGSAWPSETSRLTPHQSNYLQQIQLTSEHQNTLPQRPIPQQKATKKVIVKKEEPMTEMKRVPYRIMDRAEGGDMFEEFSCSSGFERAVQQQSDAANQQEIGAGLFKRTNQVTSIACQQQMDEASAMQAVSDLASNQAISKEERIAQLQAAQELIQRQIQDLLNAENQVKMNMQEESKSLAEGIGALALTEKIDAQESEEWIQASPIRLSQFICESPQKFSAIKASLAIKQETVEKEIDSILGESPSPSKQVERIDWTLISPQKFSLKLDRVPDQVVEVNAENNSSSDQDMSSHNLTAEEEEKDQKNLLRTYQEKDAQQAILSQRDRENAMSQIDVASSDAEKPCSEIRMTFFSPTKLSECFVNRGQNEASLRFHDAIQKHEQDLQSQQNFNIRAQMDEKLQQRLQKREDDGPADSPNTRDKKYRQMQNDIFSKIQAQLNM